MWHGSPDESLLEAAAGLGARPINAFATVTLPVTVPGIIAGSLLMFIPATGEYVVPDLPAFTLSLDDLVIASFVTGPGSSTLPILIYSGIRLGLRPDINALATIIILTVAIGVAIAAYLMLRQQKIAAAEAATR